MSSYKDLSLKLDGILETCGISTDVRQIRTECSTISEILFSVTPSPHRRCYIFGSSYESSYILGMGSDFDEVFVNCSLPVVCQTECLSDLPYSCGLLIVPDQRFPGYAKLQVLNDRTKFISEQDFVKNISRNVLKFDIQSDSQNRRCLTFTYLTDFYGTKFSNQHGPALQIEVDTKTMPTDIILAFECNTWPSLASEWLTRRRKNG